MKKYVIVIALEQGMNKFQGISRESGTECVTRQLLDYAAWR
jgi:hypothetical protein